MTDSSARRVKVLIVEDSPTQAILIESIIEAHPQLDHVATIDDGEKAVQYLKREGDFTDAARPDLVLLDLNLPNKDGTEILEEMKADAKLNDIPVVMLTSSEDKEDVSKCYAAGASSFISKPVDQNGMEQVLNQLADYWGGIIVFPEPE